MELVYLWVDEYKNIRNQGFNFSPRFTCKYEDGELTIDKREHVSIFPKNINVTAIVGENGSGKSNILEALIEIYYNFIFSFRIPLIKDSPDSFIIPMFFSKKISIVMYCYKANSFYIISNNQQSIINYCNIKLNTILLDKAPEQNIIDELLYIQSRLSILHYDYSLSLYRGFKKNQSLTGNSPATFIHINSLYNEGNDFINCVPNKRHNLDSLDVVHYVPQESLFKIMNYMSKIKAPNVITTNFFEPTQVYIEPNFYYKDNKLKFDIYSLNNFDFFKVLIVLYMLKILKADSEFNSVQDLEILVKNNKEAFAVALKDDMEASKLGNEANKIKKLFEYLDILEQYKSSFDDIFDFTKDKINLLKINVKIHNIAGSNFQLISKMDFNCFKIFIKDEKKSILFDDLSNGEKSTLRIRFYIEDLVNRVKKDNYFILLDEPSNDMHPQWQKKLLKYLIEVFKNRNETFHFILTSHSPFILSDLPKENVIFLEKGEQVYPKIETFGANIHTLLSHGFFMKDGLMGEFAKEKINNIIEFHKKIEQQKEDKTKKEELKTEYEEKKKEFWHIQSIVGEEYLKQVIKNHLVEIEKLLLGKDEAKKAEITRLQKQIELLEKEND
jgi:ABC-type multidrug transport system ATPase subunit